MSNIQRFSTNSLAIVCIFQLVLQISAARDDNSPKPLIIESLLDRWKLPALPAMLPVVKESAWSGLSFP